MTKCWNDKTDKIELKSFNHLMKTNGGDAHITSQHIYKWIESKYVYNFKLNALKYFHVLFYCWTEIGVSVCDFNRNCPIVKLADDAFYALVAAVDFLAPDTVENNFIIYLNFMAMQQNYFVQSNSSRNAMKRNLLRKEGMKITIKSQQCSLFLILSTSWACIPRKQLIELTSKDNLRVRETLFTFIEWSELNMNCFA